VLEKFGFHASGAKALEEKKELIAALKALRHPKPPPKTGDAAAPENRRLLTSKAELFSQPFNYEIGDPNR
jgi:hypothetical protein